MPEEIEIRIEGGDSLPVLVYLPGVHGDRTLIGDLSRCLRGKVRLVSCTYPRTRQWSLDDYAAAVEAALAAHGIRAGWLLAESFSSQVAWAILGRARFAAQGVILAGGFVKHPMRWIVRPAGWLCRLWVLRLIFPFYVGCAKLIRRDDRDKKELLEKSALLLPGGPNPTCRPSAIGCD